MEGPDSDTLALARRSARPTEAYMQRRARETGRRGARKLPKTTLHACALSLHHTDATAEDPGEAARAFTSSDLPLQSPCLVSRTHALGVALLISADEANVMSPCRAPRWYMSPVICEKISPRASRAALRCHDMAATFCPFHRQERGGICQVSGLAIEYSEKKCVRRSLGIAMLSLTLSISG